MFPFRADIKITDWFKSQAFTLSAEVIPPRNGAEQAKILAQVKSLIDAGAQFLAVTKGAGGSLRGGSLPIAQAIKDSFQIPCVAHFTCRDLTPEEVENQLMDHHYFGIRNILALRGDPPDGAHSWKPKEGGYSFAHELIKQISNLNQGQYLTRQGGPQASNQEQTDFCIGAAVYPEHPHPKERIEFFKAKIDAGAQYAITDMLFDPEAYARFKEGCQGFKEIPILPGTRILKTQKNAQKMMEKFRVKVPDAVLKKLPLDVPNDSAGLEAFLTLTEKLKSYGAPGIHLFVINDTESGMRGLKALKELNF